ncbi:MAG: glycoside hydrolase family 127 protein [Planctomycetes bacterium]|nr:glycoside hydrolase family 127 protein [Planctomycetota bacterium]
MCLSVLSRFVKKIRKSGIGFCLILILSCGAKVVGEDAILPDYGKMKSPPVCVPAPGTSYDLQGRSGKYLQAVSDYWLKGIVERNPAILEMFSDREKKPARDLLPWSGEFAGKYLTGAVQVLRLREDKQLRGYLNEYLKKLIALQTDSGYLGPWSKKFEFTGKGDNVWGQYGVWDTWNHYHIMMGLIFWYENTGQEDALRAACRIGDLMCEKFLAKPGSLAAIGSCTMNLAPAHSLAVLYRHTGQKKYLQLAAQIVNDDFSGEGAGNWLHDALNGKEYYQSRLPRWEALHPIMAMAELYWITGEKKYYDAFSQIWWSIVQYDRHNTGAFSTHEKAVGNPYAHGSIETCCVIAWAAMSVEMLKMTANSVVADELELTFYNAIQGYQDQSGRWCTYHTPMDGRRCPSTDAISFQRRPGSEELNCCSVNSARGFGLVSDWALMTDAEGLIVNWYGPCEMKTQIKGQHVVLRQRTDYPRTSSILLEVSPTKTEEFMIKLRVPHWSKNTTISVNGRVEKNVKSGQYASLKRIWKQGDQVEIDMDMSPHFWVGQREYQGKTSIYRGPVLLSYISDTETKFSPQWKVFSEIHASKNVGASVLYKFKGHKVKWEGYKYDDAGIALVKIDGKEVARVDQYDPVRSRPFHWEYSGLGSTDHVLEIQVTDQKRDDSKDVWINVKSFSSDDDSLAIDGRELTISLQDSQDDFLAFELSNVNGEKVILRDFDSAGRDGKSYVSWLRVLNIEPVPFSRDNPLRSSRKLK